MLCALSNSLKGKSNRKRKIRCVLDSLSSAGRTKGKIKGKGHKGCMRAGCVGPSSHPCTCVEPGRGAGQRVVRGLPGGHQPKAGR